jgi:ethanolamine utilization protein EutN
MSPAATRVTISDDAGGGPGMRLATVLGQVVATVKEPGLDRFTLLVVQDGAPAAGAGADHAAAEPSAPGAPTYVAVDLVGAGVGELVLVVGGSAARVAANAVTGTDCPTDRAVVGIADTVIERGTVTYRKS